MCFNPRPRVGGDESFGAMLAQGKEFQSAPPRGGRRQLAAALAGGEDGFNPRPRVGGDTTEMDTSASFDQAVSIRAPAWGRRIATGSTASPSSFQSAPPRGGRPGPRRGARLSQAVSIRAPAWGATRLHVDEGSSVKFQSAPPRGGRLSRAHAVSTAGIKFQSAPPRGGRHGLPSGISHHIRGLVSIRAPAWGATAGLYLIVKERQICPFARTTATTGRSRLLSRTRE